jgi:1,4-dihydroxy-2-naphthoate octaprenyltransferase
MTHYSNDYFDLEADQANATPTEWSGGSRVLPRGELPARVALVAAIVLLGIAVVATAVLQKKTAGLAPSALLALAIVLSWEYSAPPFKLHSTGAGEVIAMIIVTLLVPLIGFAAQAGTLEPIAFVSCAPLCFLQFAMLLAVEFPDRAGDEAVGKRTLIVRIGSARAAALYVVALVLAYLLLPIWGLLGLPREAVWAILVLAPLAGWLVFRVSRGDHFEPRRWNRFAFLSTALVAISTFGELGAYIALASRQE